MWANESVFYQIYPLGFCGAPFENDGILQHRILKVKEWIPHMQQLGINALYFSPVFESDTHGYNTREYHKIDVRLGTHEDFVDVCQTLHEQGIRVVLDGVFNHVGRGFWAFQDVLQYREQSIYKDWFFLDFNGNSSSNDGLWYEGWEGNYDLVKLNLKNPAVVEYLFDAIQMWIKEFDIDGLRLDVAYCLDKDFLKQLRQFTRQLKEDFFLVGELLHGDYNQWVNDEMCDSCTNYECYKGLYSSFNSMNLFEIMHSLGRQFGPENWTLYKGKHLLSFVDNHDVTRIASQLSNPRHLPLIYTLMFLMPGIPCVYYGSEWGATGRKQEGDPTLRPCFETPIYNDLSAWICTLAQIKKQSKAASYGSFKAICITNHQCVFERKDEDETLVVAINASDNDVEVQVNAQGDYIDVLAHEEIHLNHQLMLPAYASMILKSK